PHVARVLDTGFTEEGMPFVATEHLEGRTLFDEAKERGALPVEEAVRWIIEASEALAEAHANGIVHGDLKPQNLFLAHDAADDAGDGASAADTHAHAHARARARVDEPARTSQARVLKVLDFGMSNAWCDGADGDEGTFATWFASPAYIAPEQ